MERKMEDFITASIAFEPYEGPVDKKQIEDLLPFDFKGKDDFVEFYLLHNGIYFPDGVRLSTEPFIPAHERAYNMHEVELFYPIRRIRSMWDAIKEQGIEVEKFLENHFPFARDAGGNNYVIEFPSGEITYVNWEYDIEEGLTFVAPSFKDFCRSMIPLEE